MLLWTGGKWIEGLPDSLKSLSEPAFIGVSPLGWLVLALLLAGGWLLSRTAFGRDFTPLAITSPPRASWAWRSTARGCWPLPSTVCWRPAPGSSSPRRLVLCLIRPAAAGDESHRRLRAGRDLAARRYRHAAWRVSRRLFLTQIDTVLVLFRLPARWNDFIAGPVLLGVLVLDGRLRQALARHQRALKYSRFQPGNKGETGCPLS